MNEKALVRVIGPTPTEDGRYAVTYVDQEGDDATQVFDELSDALGFKRQLEFDLASRSS